MTATIEGLTPQFVDPAAHARTQESQVLLEEVAFMRGVLGMPLEKVADRLGVKYSSLLRALSRAEEKGIAIP